jgi:hypothetical protein
MPHIVLIKNADTSLKKVGDLVGVFEDNHIFSDLEQSQYNIREITGFTRQEIVDWLNDNMPERQWLYRMSVANTWTQETPEKKQAWNDNGTWRFLEVTPKYGWNFGTFTAQDAADMADPQISRATKIQLWESKIEFRFKNLPENQVEVS